MKLCALLLILITSFSWAVSFNVVTEEYPPYNYSDKGKVTGISTEIIQEILLRTGIDYQLKVYPWARSYKMATEEPNTIIYSITYTEQRKPLFKWVGPLIPTTVDVFAKKSSMIKINGYDDLKNYKIGVVKDDIGEQLLISNGVPASNLEEVAQPLLNLKKLAIDRVDMVSYEGNVVNWLLTNNDMTPSDYEKVYTLQEGQLYIGFEKNTPDDVINKCQAALDEMKKDGTYNKILQTYMK
ncbi:MAG: transporter substrate-binding domain-containing protein [Candidatus Delongbacteria bacterium]|nr:transporter substrate-binding domain-containing protein [Candidatus Delongbacteria bacterium]MBN2834010.1 transporter substrate-binding domain-containing protein [Candidatus Delongbacteria bacterium]